jgi:hypothetical protein
MPRKTDGEKIDELGKGIATLTERPDNVGKELARPGRTFQTRLRHSRT